MTQIFGASFELKIDCIEKIIKNNRVVYKNIDGVIIPPNPEDKKLPDIFQISLIGSCEFVTNLITGDKYSIVLSQHFATVGKDLVETAYKTNYDILIHYITGNNEKKHDIIKINKQVSETGNFKINQQKIVGKGAFSALYRPVVQCVLLSVENNNNLVTLNFEEVL